MRRIFRLAGNLLWTLAGLAVLLFLLYFLLNVLRKKTPKPLSSVAAMAERGLTPPQG